MVPLFTSHYSIGKSILTLEHPDKHKNGGPSSVFTIAKNNGLKNVALVENCLTGLPQALTVADELGIQLSFGLSLTICEQEHKVVIFAKNSEGCKELNGIYSEAFGGDSSCVKGKRLQKLWSDNLMLCIPFYDSFIFKNVMSFENCTPDLKALSPRLFIERNGLPFDDLIEGKVKNYASKNGLSTEVVKSIYSENKSDLEALQTYKCVCSRRFGKSTLSKPNLDHFGSDEFTFESWKKEVSK